MYSITPIQLFGLFEDVLVFCITNTQTKVLVYFEAKLDAQKQETLKVLAKYPNCNLNPVTRFKNATDNMALYEVLKERNAKSINL